MGWGSPSISIPTNVGIGTHTPGTRLHIEHSSTTFNAASGGLYLFNPNNTANSTSCLGARIGGPLANKAGVSLDVSGQYGWSMYINGNDATNRRLIFNSSWDGIAGVNDRLTIRGNDGNVGIATTDPSNILQVGAGGRLRISNGISDFSILGTKDVDDNENTRIVVCGNSRGNGLNGSIEYLATSGDHIFKTNAANERMRIRNNGIITTSSNIDCGGGIVLAGSTTLSNHPNITINNENLTNTYINFKGNGNATDDWCYLRQIGGNNAYKLALDFHDDGNDARFCIRNVASAAEPDSITEVFTVDNGNVTATGNIQTNSLSFGSRIENFLINLWGTNSYGFGMNDSTLRYNSAANHTFFSNGTQRAQINSSGLNINGIFNYNTYNQPLIVTSTFTFTGNNISFDILFKGFSNLLLLISVGTRFGTYISTGITASTAFVPSLMFSGGDIAFMLWYFTDAGAGRTRGWLGNSGAGNNIRVVITEIWF